MVEDAARKAWQRCSSDVRRCKQKTRSLLRVANKVEVAVAVGVATGTNTVGAVVAIGTKENAGEFDPVILMDHIHPRSNAGLVA